MSFLAPWVIAIAAGATIPPLVLLYFLKLRRQERLIASTLLWRQAIQDLQVNAPFQKLRNNLLLILQLLVLIMAAVAIAEPFISSKRHVEKAIVLLVDHSASMAATEDKKETRLDIARREAVKVVDDMSTDQRAMVIGFADRAQVLMSFTDDKAALRKAINAIRQTDERGRLAEAMELAEAHSTPIGEDIGTKTEVAMSHYLLFTDGRLPDADQVAVQRGALEVVRIGQATDNQAIVDLDVRRHYEQPGRVSVLARVRNFGPDEVRRDVSLFVDGELRAVAEAKLTALDKADELPNMRLTGTAPEGNEAIVPFDLELDRGARIQVVLSGQDALPADDRGYAVVTPPRPMTVLLVTPGNRYLKQAMDGMPISHYDIWSPEQYEKAPDEQLIQEGRCKYDVVVLDGHSTGRLPPGSYLFFAGVPLIEEVGAGKQVQGEVFLDWDDTHPVLRHVNVDVMAVFSWLDLKLPRQAVSLIEGTTGPVMALLNQERNQYLLCAFGLFDETRTYPNTNWIFHEGLVIFMYNSLRFLAGSSTAGQEPPVKPGEAFTVPCRPGLRETTVARPDDETDNVPVRSSGLATYGRTDRVGIYTVTDGLQHSNARAVNLLDDDESFIAPNKAFRIAAGDLQQTEGSDLSNRPLWPYFLVVLGAILMVEWIVYNKRVFI